MTKHRLGSLDATALDDALHGILSMLGDPKISASRWESYVKGTSERERAYGLLNAVGLDYGAGVATSVILALGTGQMAALSSITPEDLEAAAAKLLQIAASAEAKVKAPSKELFEEAMSEVNWPKAAREAASFSGKTHDPMGLWDYSMAREDQIYIQDFAYAVTMYPQIAAGQLEDAAIWMRQAYPVRWGPGEISYVPETLIEMGAEPLRLELIRILKDGNKEITKLGSYGRRVVALPDNLIFTKLAWSNGGEAWQVIYGENDRLVRAVARRGAKTTTLDANELLLPAHPWLVDKIASELDPLPLYGLSTEAQERGEDPEPDDQGMKEIVRRLVAQAMPGADREEHAVSSLEAWEMFQKAKKQHLEDPLRKDAIAMEFVVMVFKSAEKHGPVMPYYRVFDEWLNRP